MKIFITYVLALWSTITLAQIGINTTAPNAALEIASANSGVLIPRVQLIDINDNTTIINPNGGGILTATLVYNILASGTAPNNVVSGFYYWNGSSWMPIAGPNPDHDWYKVGTTTAPRLISDNMFHTGNVAIGKNTTSSTLDIETTNQNSGIVNNFIQNTNLGYSFAIDNNLLTDSNDGSNYNYGLRNSFLGTGLGSKIGVLNTAGAGILGSKTGFENNFRASGSNQLFGFKNTLVHTGSELTLGFYNQITNPLGSTGTTHGIENRITNNSTLETTGVFTEINSPAGGDGGTFGTQNFLSGRKIGGKIGTRNIITTDNAVPDNLIGTENFFTSATNSGFPSIYGTKNIFNINTPNDRSSLYGTYNILQGSGQGDQYGTVSFLNNNSGGHKYGNYNYLNREGLEKIGIYNWIETSGILPNTIIQKGIENLMINSVNSSNLVSIGVDNNISSTGTGRVVGMLNNLSSSGTNGTFGIHNTIGGNSTGGGKFGIWNDITSDVQDLFLVGVRSSVSSNFSGGGSNTYGTFNDVYAYGSSNGKGVVNQLFGNTTGNLIAVDNLFTNSTNGQEMIGIKNYFAGSGTGTKYGTQTVIETTAGGTHFGIHSTVLKPGTTNFAGYFLGNVAVGTTNSNIYTFPASRGTNGQVIQTNGIGVLTWQNPATINSATSWSLLGNSITAGTNFIGSTNDADVSFRRNSSNIGYLGTFNIALGLGALQPSAGVYNVAIGVNALSGLTAADQNVAVGWNALSNVTTGGNNIGIGTGATVPTANANNQIRLGNANISYAGTQVAWTITSDKRWKKNIEPTTLGLNFINKLNPVSYIRKNDEYNKTEFGFIAQELDQSLNDFGATNNGIISKDDNGMMGVRYNDLLAPMVKAIQEQQAMIKKLIEENQKLATRIQALESKK